ELAVFAGEEKRHVGVFVLVAVIDFAAIEGFGIDVDADGKLIKFGEVHDLVNRFHGINKGRMCAIQLITIRGNNFAMARCGIEFFNAVVTNVQTANGCRHPAVLIAMVMDAAVLANFPTQSHALEQSILEDQIAGVAPFREENIVVQACGTHGVVDDVVLDSLKIKIPFRNGGKAGDPVADADLPNGNVFRHRKTPARTSARQSTGNQNFTLTGTALNRT